MSLAAYGRLIRENRNFRLLWTAQIVSELGDWFYSISIYSLLLQWTGSARMVALAFLMQVLPQCLMAPAAGVLNDRLSRKRLMIFADLARAGIVISMIFVQSQGTLWLLMTLLFLETVCWAVFEPGRSAVIPNVVAHQDIAPANALSSATWSANFAVGAALGGLVDVAFGRNTVFVINSISFLASALLIRRMKFAEPHAESLPPLRARDLADFSPIAEGVRYVTRDPRLASTMFVKCGLGFMGSNWVILPVLGQRIFPLQLNGLSPQQGGTLAMSLLMAMRGSGAILGALFSGLFAGTDPIRLRRTVLASFLMGAIGYIALGFAGALGMAMLAVMFAHAGGSAAWTASTTLLQELTEDRFRGRVFSAEFALFMLALAASSFIAGQLADRGVDIRTLAIGTGVLTLAPAVVWLAAGKAWKK